MTSQASLHYTVLGLAVPVLADLKLRPSLQMSELPRESFAEEELIQDGAMDLDTPKDDKHQVEQQAHQGRRGRRASLSAHTSPTRRVGFTSTHPDAPFIMPHSPRSAALSPSRFRSGSAASNRPGFYRSASSISTSTGYSSVSGFGFGTFSPQPSLPMTPAEVEFEEGMPSIGQFDQEMDAVDTGLIEQELRASRITQQESFAVVSSSHSPVGQAQTLSQTTKYRHIPGRSASACSHVQSTSYSTSTTLTPDRINRKRRNSRFHASMHSPSRSVHNQDKSEDVQMNKRVHKSDSSSSSSLCHTTSMDLSDSCISTTSVETASLPVLSILVPSPESAISTTSCPSQACSHDEMVKVQSQLVEAAAAAVAVPAPMAPAHHLQQQAQPQACAPAAGSSLPPTHPAAAHHTSHHRQQVRPHLPYSSTRGPLISVLSCVLEQLFSNPNDTLPSDPKQISMFHTERIPSISIGQYLDRIAFYSECSEEALVMAFVHISRIYHSNTGAGSNPPGQKTFQLNTLSIHRLLLVAVMCSAKFHDDSYFNNAFFGRIGGVATKELNALEVEFLALIAFELYIPSKIYRRFYTELMNSALHPCCKCQYRLLPPLLFQDSLPSSPSHDCSSSELSNGVDLLFYHPRQDSESGAGGKGGVRPTPMNLLSPITPLEKAQTNHHNTNNNTANKQPERSVHLDYCEVKQAS